MTALDTLSGFLRRDWDRAAAIPHMPPDAADPRWETLVAAALHHGVTPLLCRALADLPAGSVPASIAQAGAQHLARSDEAHAAAVTQLQDAIAHLAAAGIPAVAYKGPALGMLAHASATLRPLRDLDMVVLPHDLPRAIAALREQDYAVQEPWSPAVMRTWCRDHGQVTLGAPGLLPIDLHGLLAPRTLAVALDVAGMWARARPLALGRSSLPTFALEDTLLAICLHGTKEKWWRLLWVADVAALVARHPALDWDAAFARAQAAGMARMLDVGLALADGLFAAPLPATIAQRVRRDRRGIELAAASRRLLSEAPADPGSVYRLSGYHWHAHERLRDRLRYAWRTAVTPGDRHYRMVRLPAPLVPGYAAVKVVHDYALEPVWNASRRMLRGTRTHADVPR